MSTRSWTPFTVGLTGGIGSGKTTVARMLAQRGGFVVDADAVARDVVARGSEGLHRLVEEFGREILTPDQRLDRSALAARAFSDGSARARMNAITHPLIASRTGELFAAAPPGAVCIHDVALLVEFGLSDAYDAVVVVDCPEELRLQRLAGRGFTESEARARMGAQATREERLAAADFVIDNSGSLADLERQVDGVWERLVALAAGPAETATRNS